MARAGPPARRCRSADVQERQVLLDPSGETVRFDGSPSWVCANADGIGFYRTAYEPEALTSLLGAISQLSPLERFGVIDDAWALMLAGHASIEDVVAALGAAGRDPAPGRAATRAPPRSASSDSWRGPTLGDDVASFARHLAEGRVEDDPGARRCADAHRRRGGWRPRGRSPVPRTC